jgi:hypothetical protein
VELLIGALTLGEVVFSMCALRSAGQEVISVMNPNAVSPNAIMNQVWQGRVPADWQVIHGKRRSAFAVGCSATFVTLVLLFILAVGAVVISGFVHFGSGIQPGQSPSSFLNPASFGSATIAGYPALAVVGGVALVIALLVGIIAGFIAGRDSGDPDPELVILPNGFVEYVSHRKPIISIPFAEIADVDLRVKTTTYHSTNTNANTSFSTTTTRTRTDIWLDLYYRNGNKEKWQPRAKFGPTQSVCQMIIKAHARYSALQGHR